MLLNFMLLFVVFLFVIFFILFVVDFSGMYMVLLFSLKYIEV